MSTTNMYTSAGYQAALRDLGRTDYTVHVYKDGVLYYSSDYTEYGRSDSI